MRRLYLLRSFVGFSTNFRKEAAVHFVLNWKVFLVHQFDNIEQILVTSST